MKNSKQDTLKIIAVIFLYMVWFYVVSVISVRYEWLISINDVSGENILQEFLSDFLTMLFFAVMLLTVYRKRLSEFEFKIKGNKEIVILIFILAGSFLWNRDFSIHGFYELFFYVVVVAFSEEVIFRGYMYNQLKRSGKIKAILISGAFFGATHALLPAAMVHADFMELMYQILNQVGGGIFGGFIFVLFLEAGQSLWVPILIHAIMDYSSGLPSDFSIVFYFGSIVYYLIKYKRNKKING